MAETEQRYLSVVTRGCYLGVPWHNEVAVYCSDRLAFPHRWEREENKCPETEINFVGRALEKGAEHKSLPNAPLVGLRLASNVSDGLWMRLSTQED